MIVSKVWTIIRHVYKILLIKSLTVNRTRIFYMSKVDIETSLDILCHNGRGNFVLFVGASLYYYYYYCSELGRIKPAAVYDFY